MKRYIVTRKKYLSEEEYQTLLKKGNYTHVKKTGEQKFTPVTPEDLEYDNPWINVLRFFKKKRAAIEYADNIVNTGIDGSYAEVEKATDFLWVHARIPVYAVNRDTIQNPANYEAEPDTLGAGGTGKTAKYILPNIIEREE